SVSPGPTSAKMDRASSTSCSICTWLNSGFGPPPAMIQRMAPGGAPNEIVIEDGSSAPRDERFNAKSAVRTTAATKSSGKLQKARRSINRDLSPRRAHRLADAVERLLRDVQRRSARHARRGSVAGGFDL